nr:ribosomal protein L35AE/L33A [Mucilaginibacter sp. E4BP6]
MTVSLIISIPDKMLVYYTVNCFGNKRETKIYLPTAIISYEYRQVRKYIKGMRLKIYGRNGDSVTLREDMDGYRQGELDQIVAFIAELKP